MVRGVGFEPTQACAAGKPLRQRILSPPSPLESSSPNVHGFHNDLSSILSFISGKVKETRFLKWLLRERGISKDTALDYVRYVKKPYNPKIRHSVAAYRLAVLFLKDAEKINLTHILEYLKIPKSGIDRKVPSEHEVVETLKFLRKERPHDIYPVYLVLLESGLRLRHALLLLRNIDRLHVVRFNGFYRVDLNIVRGEKKALHTYLIHLPSKLSIAENTVSNYASKHRLVNPKYVRKFVITKMHECNIEDPIVKFISGHLSEADIHDTRYYEKLAKSQKQYPQYAQWLQKNILSKVIK